MLIVRQQTVCAAYYENCKISVF